MKRFYFRFSVLSSLLLAGPLFGAKFWESKPFTEWTEKECLEMLTKSPWVYSSAFGSTISIKEAMPTRETQEAGAGLAGSEKPASFGEREVTYFFDFRFLTAAPVRMAMARMRLIRNPGDAALQEELNRFVQNTPDTIIAIEIDCRANPMGDSGLHDIASYFTHASFPDLRDSTYLMSTPGNKQLPLADLWTVTPTRPRPAFVFPRLDGKGNPNFSGDEKSIALRSEFLIDVKGKRQKFGIYVRMNPKQLVYQGRFVL